MVSAIFTDFFEQRYYVSGFPLARQLAKREGLIDFNRAYIYRVPQKFVPLLYKSVHVFQYD